MTIASGAASSRRRNFSSPWLKLYCSWFQSAPSGGNLALCRGPAQGYPNSSLRETRTCPRHRTTADCTGRARPQSRPDRHPHTEVIFKHVSSGAAITQPKMPHALARLSRRLTVRLLVVKTKQSAPAIVKSVLAVRIGTPAEHCLLTPKPLLRVADASFRLAVREAVFARPPASESCS